MGGKAYLFQVSFKTPTYSLRQGRLDNMGFNFGYADLFFPLAHGRKEIPPEGRLFG